VNAQVRATVQKGLAHDKEDAVKLIVDTTGKQVTATKEPVERLDQNGKQRYDKETGRAMWSTQVFVLDQDGGEVITVHTAGEKPELKVGQLVSVSNLEALPWATNGRNGVSFRAIAIKPVTVTASGK
jgi:hypothetical protein